MEREGVESGGKKRIGWCGGGGGMGVELMF